MDQLEVLRDIAEDHHAEVRDMYTLAALIVLVLRCTGLAAWRSGQVTSDLVVSVCAQILLSVILGGILWWMVGHGIASGDGSVIGTTQYTPSQDRNKFETVWLIEFLVAITALDGMQSVLVGRIRFFQYIILTIVSMGFTLPITYRFIWGDSWLRPGSGNAFLSGFFDPSGGLTASLYAGGTAIACYRVVGSRDFGGIKDAMLQRRALEGHNYFFQATGFLMVWMILFMQIGNGILQDKVEIGYMGNAYLFVIVSSSFGAISSLLLSLDVNRHYKLSAVVNGLSASLVASCSACHCTSTAWAPLTGTIAAVLYFGSRYILDRMCVDDPFLIFSSVFAPAIWGSLVGPLFAETEYFTTVYKGKGLFTNGNSDALFSHIVGGLAIVGWSSLSMTVTLEISRRLTHFANNVTDTLDYGGWYCDIPDMFGSGSEEQAGGGQALLGTSFCMVEDFLPDDMIAGRQSLAHCTTRNKSVAKSQPQTEPEHQKRNVKQIAIRWALFLSVLFGSLGGSLAQPDGETTTESNNDVQDISHIIGNITLLISNSKGDLNTTWVLLCGIIVFSMQLGFCYIESGGVRSSSVINITFKNIGDCAIGSMCWWLMGYGLSYADGGVFFASNSDLFAMSPIPGSEDGGRLAHFFLSFTYMTTAVTIISGAVAERISLPGYYMIVASVSSFFYPLVVRTIWSEYGFASPWSTNRIGSGCLDFAGSLVIHMFGGLCALVMAYLVGHRKLANGIDLFSDEGQEMVTGHNKFQTAAGTLLLWFAWFAFNAGSVLQISDGGAIVAANAIVCTLLASSTAGIVGLATSLWIESHYDVGHVCNCVLAGLVSITAGCAYMSPVYSPIVGAIGCFIYIGVRSARIKLRIDDVIDAGAVHFGGGLWGGISTGLFSDCERIRVATGDMGINNCGLFVGGGWTLVGVQIATALSVIGWSILCSLVLYVMVNITVGIRVDPLFEILGIDQSEHMAHSYDYIEKIQAERSKAVEAQEVAEKVTQAMSLFNLENAEEVIRYSRAHNDCELYRYFDRLLENLKLYKPYLPSSLFQDDVYSAHESSLDSEESCTIIKENTTVRDTVVPQAGKLATGLNRQSKATLLHGRLLEGHEVLSIPERVTLYTMVIALFEEHVKDSRGCLMKVEGNSILAAWGTSSFVAMAGSVAARVALTVLAKFRSSVLEERYNGDLPLVGLVHENGCNLYIGIAGGSVLTGNIGTSNTRSSIVLGNIVSQVETLSNIGPYIQCRLLFDRFVSQNCMNSYETRPVDVVSGVSFSFAQEIYEISSVKQARQDHREWMYELQQSEKENAWLSSNYVEAFKSMRMGEFKEAISYFDSHIGRSPSDKNAIRLRALAVHFQFESRYKQVHFWRCIHSPPFSLYPGERVPQETFRGILISALALVAGISLSIIPNKVTFDNDNIHDQIPSEICVLPWQSV